MSEAKGKKEFKSRVILALYNQQLRSESRLVQELLKEDALQKPSAGILIGFESELKLRKGELYLDVKAQKSQNCLVLNYELDYEKFMKYVEEQDKSFHEQIVARTIDYYNECKILDEQLVFADFFYDKSFQAYVFTVKIPEVQEFDLNTLTAPKLQQSAIDWFSLFLKSLDYQLIEHQVLKLIKSYELSEPILKLLEKESAQKTYNREQILMIKSMTDNFVGEKIFNLPFYKQDSGFFDHDRIVQYSLK